MRIYAEAARFGKPQWSGQRGTVPTGYAIAPRELLMAPRRLAEERTNLQRWSVLPRGGHFLPYEQPDLLAAEYRAFFKPFRN
jgi:pimeloyl-ACP methyl ester carboxylesterase